MKIVFMGTPKAAVSSLEKIIKDGHEITAVYTQPDKPAGRGRNLTASPVKQFALDNSLQIFQPVKIKTPEALEIFKSHQADVTVVVAYGRILPQGFLEAFPHGAINVHFSLLPKYRGAAPVNWAIVNGEKETGVTTMQMDEGLDTGAILLQRETLIEEEENAIELMDKLAISGANLLSETLKTFETLIAQPQDDSKATFAPIMKKEDGVVDWHFSAQEISNRVRGFQPFPTSFSTYKGKRLTIWKAFEVKNEKAQNKQPGEILQAKGNELFVVCGNQTILNIEELQLEGKRRMTTRDFLNGVKMQNGEILGNLDNNEQ